MVTARLQRDRLSPIREHHRLVAVLDDKPLEPGESTIGQLAPHVDLRNDKAGEILFDTLGTLLSRLGDIRCGGPSMRSVCSAAYSE